MTLPVASSSCNFLKELKTGRELRHNRIDNLHFPTAIVSVIFRSVMAGSNRREMCVRSHVIRTASLERILVYICALFGG